MTGGYNRGPGVAGSYTGTRSGLTGTRGAWAGNGWSGRGWRHRGWGWGAAAVGVGVGLALTDPYYDGDDCVVWNGWTWVNACYQYY